jgi:hypothetical protein
VPVGRTAHAPGVEEVGTRVVMAEGICNVASLQFARGLLMTRTDRTIMGTTSEHRGCKGRKDECGGDGDHWRRSRESRRDSGGGRRGWQEQIQRQDP